MTVIVGARDGPTCQHVVVTGRELYELALWGTIELREAVEWVCRVSESPEGVPGGRNQEFLGACDGLRAECFPFVSEGGRVGEPS